MEVEPIVIPLSKTYEGTEGPFEKLNLRQPTAKDFITGGIPVKLKPFGDTMEFEIVPEAMNAFLVQLSGRFPTDIRKLTPGDWMAAAYAVVPFFVPNFISTSPPPSSTSPQPSNAAQTNSGS